MKIGLGSLKKDIDRVTKVREAIGPEVKLMVDANHCFNVPQAINIGRELEKLDVYWFEEPVSPEDLEGYIEVSRRLDMAVAGGENEFTKFGFRDILARGAMDIVQPDVCAAGGITECKKIAALAQAHCVQCVPHAWGTAIGSPPLCSSSPRCLNVLHAWCRCRLCWNTSRPSIPSATSSAAPRSSTSRDS